ncbi:6-phosphofructokinase [Petrocella sp. FN5]|uniref:6-phosphofructokinase n=1 Tax=Petrocella sp. FN5 TaxID=3032002 RepID=UPI0023DB04CD|nr:6-phosphofructokinase [Petrocella sp. FN5]MDF1616535.1 6-phosphofructokinase [Petrocella sp. FN5]
MSNCIVAQSGGPTAAINASLSGVIEAAFNDPSIDIVYGSLNGIAGVLENNILNLTTLFGHNPESLEQLKHTPAMYLGSCRYKLPHYSNNVVPYEKIFRFFKEKNIDYFFYIGGNDSMDTVHKLSLYAKDHKIDVKIIGIPKTIDNDLVETDHTPGFGSAAKYVATTLLEIAHDTYIYNLESVTIVEIMGRNAGWLTAASALARTTYSTAPDLIYLPEMAFDVKAFIEQVKALQKTQKNIIVAVSEGIKDKDGNYIAASVSGTYDAFGHAKLSGVGKTLEYLLADQLGCKVRSIELSVLQRAAGHIASYTDIHEAVSVGKAAVEAATNGLTGKMMAIRRLTDMPYEITIQPVDVTLVANHEKPVPAHYINSAGDDVTRLFLDYASPLIQGETLLTYKNGLPHYLNIHHLKN